ncbi:NADH dehydrogenase [ubiquinone] 1 alpha subcomplex subunit 12-like [Styela clava]|uniref:NADH dehydrogenase [ubiquinone] 1 alpha subcomplex subunit 12-like n=1 Tax=Styela clava TaxID=7725 RepID=UPI00193A3D7B|nr:NADH dehydrogenase [ubiquinone] 1 alpha subcomplex subunit 12-like [Styela clava]
MSKGIVDLIRRQVRPFQEFFKLAEFTKAQDNGYFPRIRGFFVTVARTNELRRGDLIGTDDLGNKYYENNRYFVGRNRWVDYAQDTFAQKWEFNASQVPSEWHRWLHYMTDDPPTKVPPTPRPFMMKHEATKTGTDDCYVPYSTTRPKIQSWKPPQ